MTEPTDLDMALEAAEKELADPLSKGVCTVWSGDLRTILAALAAIQQSPISGEGADPLALAKTVLDWAIVATENNRMMLSGRDPGQDREDRQDALVNKMVSLARAIQYPAPPVPSVSDQGSSLRDTQPGAADGSSSNEGAGA